MKKVLFGLMIAAAFTACNDSAKTEEPKTDSTAVAPAAADTTAKPADTTAAPAAADTAKKADTTKK